ncbi:hypothetical protein EDB85DRAFT_1895721 [Lactarius pseudohatsudake]|nr:hypothetical protein EDB85DRAFT_1895721 [Lactarius pseudohatsudake]
MNGKGCSEGKWRRLRQYGSGASGHGYGYGCERVRRVDGGFDGLPVPALCNLKYITTVTSPATIFDVAAVVAPSPHRHLLVTVAIAPMPRCTSSPSPPGPVSSSPSMWSPHRRRCPGRLICRPKSPSPPPPPPCSTQAHGRRLQPIPTYKSAAPRDDVATLGHALTRPASDDGTGTTALARQRDPDSVGHDGATTTVRPRRPTTPMQPRCNSTRKRRWRDHNSVGHGATTTPYSTQEPPQRYPHTARNPHHYDTNDDGDATAGTARSWAGRAGSIMQQELSSSGGPRVTVSPSPARDSPRDYTPTADIPFVESANMPEDPWWDWQAEEDPRVQERVWAAIEALEDTARTGRLVSDRSPSPSQNRCQEPWE